jgi:hypothetical protein
MTFPYMHIMCFDHIHSFYSSVKNGLTTWKRKAGHWWLIPIILAMNAGRTAVPACWGKFETLS